MDFVGLVMAVAVLASVLFEPWPWDDQRTSMMLHEPAGDVKNAHAGGSLSIRLGKP